MRRPTRSGRGINRRRALTSASSRPAGLAGPVRAVGGRPIEHPRQVARPIDTWSTTALKLSASALPNVRRCADDRRIDDQQVVEVHVGDDRRGGLNHRPPVSANSASPPRSCPSLRADPPAEPREYLTPDQRNLRTSDDGQRGRHASLRAAGARFTMLVPASIRSSSDTRTPSMSIRCRLGQAAAMNQQVVLMSGSRGTR